MAARRPWRLLLAGTALALGCEPSPAERAPPSPSAAPDEIAPPSPVASASAPASPRPPPTAAAGSSPSCPPEMRLVEGRYCPTVEQVCLGWDEVVVGGRVARNQCRRFRDPTRCLARDRVPMRYCMDTYEWPNERGAVPRNLTSWQEARDLCAGVGKRLCTDVEFTLACEGEAMKPHVHGFERDGARCSYDLPYRPRVFTFTKHDACAADEACRSALAAIDQRKPSGAMEGCVSEHGVFDLNGNVNEWVELPGRGLAKRAGLKGGWWGPVRDRCRPITTFHGESDFGYEVGFRCCKDAAPAPPR